MAIAKIIQFDQNINVQFLEMEIFFLKGLSISNLLDPDDKQRSQIITVSTLHRLLKQGRNKIGITKMNSNQAQNELFFYISIQVSILTWIGIQLFFCLIQIQILNLQTGMTEAFFSFMNGMVAGWSQVFVMQPFEIIKVRLQTQSATDKMYSGILDCLQKIVKNEGALALYKGSLTPFIGVGILGSTRFGFYENAKKQLSQSKGLANSGQLDRLEKAVCAFFAGIGVSFILGPLEHTRIRVQIQRSATDRVYTGSVDAAVKIFKQHGIRGLYRGQTPSTVRQSTGLAFYFTFIEGITDALTPEGVTQKKDLPVYVPFIAGGIGGTFYWVFNYPFDYVKTLMQTDNLNNLKYKSTIQCFRDSYQSHGIKGFYKGYVICMMRSFPVNAAAIVVYRMMQRATGVQSH